MRLLNVIKMLLGIALGCSVSLAHGVTVTVQADYFLAANPNFGIPSDISDSQNQSNNSGASVNVGTGYGNGVGAAGASAYADALGVIGTRAGGVEQVFNASSSASSATTVTNNTSGDMHYSYTLNVPFSSVGMYANWFGAGDTFTASNQFSVSLNGNTIWGSSASLNMTSTGVNLMTSGETLPWISTIFTVGTNSNHFNGGGRLELSNFTLQLDLGVWGAGQSFTLDYNIFSSVAVNAPLSCGYECFNIEAYIGDPTGSFGVPILGDIIGSPVPVPGAIWLLGSGLLGLAGVTRRRSV